MKFQELKCLKRNSKVDKACLFNKMHVLASKLLQLGSGCTLSLGPFKACLLKPWEKRSK